MSSPPPPPRKGKTLRRLDMSDTSPNDPFATPQKRPRPPKSNSSPKQFESPKILMPSINAMNISPYKNTKSPNKNNSSPYKTPVKTKVEYKVLGHGSKGCVVWPSFSNPNDKTLVGKLMADQKDAEHEYQISTVLSQLDPNQNYLVYPKNMEQPAMPMEANTLLRSQCDDFMKASKFGKNFYELTMKYGEDSDIYELSVQEFMKVIKNIIRGVDTLQKAGYVHQDLEPKNVIAIDGTYKIIDFSECKKAEEIYTSANKEKLENLSPIIPPEVMVYLQTTNENEIGNYLSRMKFDQNQCKELWMKLHEYKTEQDVHKVVYELSKRKMTSYQWASYALKMDVFAIGMIILSYIHHIEISSSPSKNKDLGALEKLAKFMTMLDPEKRIDISTCVQILA